MAEPTADVANDSIDRRKDVEQDEKPQSSKFWIGEIMAARKREKSWVTRANKVIARYRDERGSDRTANSERRANILWSNTETLKSTLFQGVGNPDVRRRFPKKGEEDKAARQAALVLERSLSYCSDAYDADGQIEACVEDELLPGRGSGWIVYDAEISEGYGGAETKQDDDTAPEPAAEDKPELSEQPGGPEIADQSVRVEHVYFQDFLTSAGRKWSDVWWVARGHDYSRDELTRYFPKHAKKIPLDVQVAGYDTGKAKNKEEEDTFQRGRVWEIWDKSKKRRVYIAEGYPEILQADDDPYKLKDFFPTVEPLYGVKTTSSLVPIPEYTLYQDQAEELDLITTRISRLIDALRRRGVYDAGTEGSEGALSSLAFAGDNEFLPIRNFPSLMEKGGLERVFMSEDVQPIANIVQSLYEQRAMLVQTIYEITGISDILRGASDPDETATAQRIKGQFGSLRLQKRQKRIQTFVRDLYRLKAEIIAEHFTREQLQDMTGIDMPLAIEKQQAIMALTFLQKMSQPQPSLLPPPGGGQGGPPQGAPGQAGPGAGPPPQGPQPTPLQPQPSPAPQIDPKRMQQLIAISKAPTWEEISAILRSDKRRGYKVDIETDATNAMDAESEKAQRIEFLTAMEGFMEKVMPGIMQFPALAPLSKELASFAVGAFKVGRTMEEAFEDAFEQIEQMAKAAQANGPKPDPEEQKLQLEAKSKQMEFAFKEKTAQQDAQIKQQEFEHTSKMKEAEFAHQTRLEEFKASNEAALAQRKLEQEQQLKSMEFDFQQQQMAQTAELEQHKLAQSADMESQKFARTAEMEDRKFGHQQQMDGEKLNFERERHTHQQAFDREKYENELLQSGTPATGDGTAPQSSSLGQLMQMFMQGQQQQAEMFTAALQQISEQNAQALRIATAPKRLAKDPKTGEKRVEIMMQ